VDAHLVAELEVLARTGFDAADRFTAAREVEAEAVYELLRSRAGALNRAHGWAGPDYFAALFPTVEAQNEIESLDDQCDIDASIAKEPGAPVQRLLRHLAAWATGLLTTADLGDDGTGSGTGEGR
jgi:hypothetical protein